MKGDLEEKRNAWYSMPAYDADSYYYQLIKTDNESTGIEHLLKQNFRRIIKHFIYSKKITFQEKYKFLNSLPELKLEQYRTLFQILLLAKDTEETLGEIALKKYYESIAYKLASKGYDDCIDLTVEIVSLYVRQTSKITLTIDAIRLLPVIPSDKIDPQTWKLIASYFRFLLRDMEYKKRYITGTDLNDAIASIAFIPVSYKLQILNWISKTATTSHLLVPYSASLLVKNDLKEFLYLIIQEGSKQNPALWMDAALMLLDENDEASKQCIVKQIQLENESSLLHQFLPVFVKLNLEDAYDHYISCIRQSINKGHIDQRFDLHLYLDTIPEIFHNKLKPYALCAAIIAGNPEKVTKQAEEIFFQLKQIGSHVPLYFFPVLRDHTGIPAQKKFIYLLLSFEECKAFPISLLRKIAKHISSDSEKIHFIYDLLFAQRDFVYSLSRKEILLFYKLFVFRARERSRGITAEAIELINDVIKGNINITKDFLLLKSFLSRKELRTFSSVIYIKYRNISLSERELFFSFIGSLTNTIQKGTKFSELKEMMQQAKIHTNDDLIFSVIMQIIPVETNHLSLSQARVILKDALRQEDEIESDLFKISPSLYDHDTRTGKAITIPIRESFRILTGEIHDREILGFFENAYRTSFNFEDLWYAESREDFSIRLTGFIYSEKKDHIKKIREKYQAEESRFEALSALLDLLSENLNDLIRTQLFQYRQNHSRQKLHECAGKLSIRTGIPLIAMKYAGGFKHSQLLSLLESYLSGNRGVYDFFSETLLFKHSTDERITSWNSFIHYIKNKSSLKDNIVKELEDHVQALSDTENIKNIELTKIHKETDAASRLLSVLVSESMEPLRESIRKAISAYSEERSEESVPVTFRIGKSAWLSLFGGLADLCIAADTALFAKDNFTLISMVYQGRYEGFLLIHYIVEEDKKIMVLAGCEPTLSFIARHSADEIYKCSVKILFAFAKMAGIDYVVQIAEQAAFSNREKISSYIIKNVVKNEPDGYLKEPLYLGSFKSTSYRGQAYYYLTEV